MNEGATMVRGTIEHANLTVSDIDRSSALFKELLGWRERWRGPTLSGGETIHVGNERAYLALYTDRLAHERFA
jgi:glyoxylase I family protein